MPTSAFYSTWSGPCCTSSAQIVISTTENTFEAFIVDNYRFIDINELFDWLFAVIDDSDLVIDNWICDVSDEKLFNRLYSKIINKSENDKIILKQIISNMCDQDKKFIYYKNNLLEFISDHINVLNLYRSIFLNVNNYEYFTDDDWEKNIKRYGFTKEQFGSKKKWDSFVNKEYFMDPNDVPDSIKDDVEELSNILMKYIYVPYMPFDRIYRLKNFKRRCVTVIDTDSNILALDTFVNYTLDHVLTSNYGREKMNNVFIAVNTITYIITKVVTDILLLYGKYANIPEEYRPSLNMKNEFFFSKLVIGKSKKRYLSKVLLREGNLMKKPKTDIKGFDFVKASCSEESEAFYTELIDKYIMGEQIDVVGLRNALQEYANSIYDRLKSGDTSLLPLGSAKDIDAYKQPESNQVVKGMLTWNMLYPDDEIEIPSKPSLLKLRIYKESDLERIKDSYPYEYQVLKDGIFHDTSGFFIKHKSRKNSKGEEKDVISEAGCTVLCIPPNRKIPEWCIDYIDYTTVIDNILGPFKSIIEILGIQNISVGKSINGRSYKTESISNIVKF